MISGRLRAAGAILGFVLGVFPAMAFAQTEPMLPLPVLPVGPEVPLQTNIPLEGGQTVDSRARPELDPLGFRVGQFFIFPRLEVDEAYSDNIFATRSGAVGDFITALQPGFDIRSDFGTNALNLSAGAIIQQYISHSSFDTQDPYIKGDGRLDVDAVHDFHGSLNYQRLHLDPGSPNFAGNAAQPQPYTTYGGAAGFEQTKLRVNYSADLSAERSEYEAVPAVGGGLVQESENNDWAYELALRGAYEFRTGYQAFVRGAVNLRDYDHAEIGSPIRSSYGYRTDVGVRIDLTGVTYVDAYVGYLDQIYESAQLGSISGVDFGTNAVWNVTELTSLSFNVSRSAQDVSAAVVGTALVPGYFHTVVGARVDHELLRNLLLNGQLTYANDDFQGEDRTDSDYMASIGAKYLLNRNLYLGATYTFEHRDSSGAQAINQFTRNIIMLRASTQF